MPTRKTGHVLVRTSGDGKASDFGRGNPLCQEVSNLRQHLHLRRSPQPDRVPSGEDASSTKAMYCPVSMSQLLPRSFAISQHSIDSTGPRYDRKFKPVALRQNQIAADKPELTPPERTVARVEGWILGVPGLIRERDLDCEGIISPTVH